MNRHTAWLSALIVTIVFVMMLPIPGQCFPVTIPDATGRMVTFNRSPRRAISLVPSITETILALDAEEALKGVTYHDADLTGGDDIVIAGGFSSPSIEIMESLNPDIIFISDMHRAIMDHFSGSQCSVLYLETGSLAKSRETIRRLGLIFNKEEQAAGIIAAIQAELDLIARKTARIPVDKRQRVIRLMGEDNVMTPGADSFQNEMIRAAGGIPHAIGQNGAVIPVSLDQWQAFDPQLIYGCKGDNRTAAAFFDLPGWKEASAVKSGRIFYFPCALTCRAGTRSGEFVSWLSATIYTQPFSDTNNLILKEGVLETGHLPAAIDLPDYVKNSLIVRGRIYDFINKTFILDFTKPMTILSSLEGWRDEIQTVGNHYLPPPCWPISHELGWDAFRDHVLEALGRKKSDTALLFTGADMDNLSVRQAKFKDLTVWACVTAGVTSNAMRMSADEGAFYEPGTINIIILSSMPLTRRAMTRALITATEAKTAALLDMDIRSSFNRGAYRATGTGTDNVLVIQGEGKPVLDNAGGHSRLGQLIAEAVYAGVREAVKKQNHLTENRSVFLRLEERNISIYGLVDRSACECNRPESAIVAELEKILLDPTVAGFMELSFSISDDYEKGLLLNLTAFNRLALDICSQLADKEITRIKDHINRDDLPVVVETALNALLTAIYQREP